MNNVENLQPSAGLATLSPQELWSVAAVSEFLHQASVPASAPTIYRKVAAGTFPAPLRYGLKCTRWRAADVRTWVATAGQAPE